MVHQNEDISTTLRMERSFASRMDSSGYAFMRLLGSCARADLLHVAQARKLSSALASDMVIKVCLPVGQD